MWRFFVLFVLLSSFLYSQSPIVVSTEPEPSRFKQGDVTTFPVGDKNIAIWNDDRDGVSSYYAQFLDKQNQPVGANFKVAGNYMFVPSSNTSFLNFYEGYSSWGDNTYYTVGLGIIEESTQLVEVIPLRSTNLGWCGTGYLGVFTDVIVKDEYFILFSCLNGLLERTAYNNDGTEITDLGDGVDPEISNYATLSSAARNSNGEYLNLFIAEESYNENYVVCNLYDTFNNLTNTFRLQELEGNELWSYLNSYNKMTRVIPDEDDNFIVTWFNVFDNSIYYNKISPSGVVLYPTAKKLEIDSFNTDAWNINSFAFSPFLNGTCSFVFSYSAGTDSGGNLYNHHLIKLDSAFNILDEKLVTNHTSIVIKETPVFDEEMNLVVGKSKNKDAYIYTLNDFENVYELQVNDDVKGANQHSTKLNYYEEDKYLVLWEDEGLRGRELDAQNNFLSDELELPSSNIFYTENGYKFIPGTKGSSSGPRSVGVNLYDENWNLVKWVMVDTTEGSSFTSAFSKINGVVYSATSHNDTLTLSKYNYLADIVDQQKIAYSQSLSALQIFPIDEEKFLVSNNGTALTYNTAFEIISLVEISVPWGAAFAFDENKFASLVQVYSDPVSYYDLVISTFDGQTVFEGKNIINYATPANLYKINSKEFLLMYYFNKRFRGKVFNSSGHVVKGEFSVAGGADTNVKDLAVNIGDSKVRFAWAENRVSGEGYNIYSSIYDKDLVTAVEEESKDLPLEFTLKQNYPNPFNPSTKISFTIHDIKRSGASLNNTKLLVYDILGREVKTLINKPMQPGFYEIEFDGSDLTSGVYFCRLSNGKINLTKKMLLVK